MNRPRRRVSRRAGLRRSAVTGTAVLVLALTTACSGEGGADPAGSPSASASAPGASEVPVESTVRKVTGRLARPAREALVADIAAVVDGWFQAAYLSGDFPRTAPYTAADFPGFTPAAAARAARSDFLSNAGIAGQVESVTPVAKRVALDVLAVGGEPQGVSAAVDLVFTTTGAVAGTERVRGHLALTPQKGAWRVFGFEVQRGPAGGGAG